ncbi:MAG: hypothetical protein AVDCRST_MAG18-4100 [uncultured Thermomicrobiales bacterium]|uniref:Beta-lactamase-related domain-containing protein n=1 Tax=uncultured Thermomicrobiales bacterium TaxID=1645740 RepID=A0A6J4VS52_9BACT|nr:MAG: hypothetical protein AVDCRST_MAG18-4100 [uncultured Thermomicrobiales bacterium]
MTNVDHPPEVDPDILFQIGSTTKTVTVTAAMRLVEAGKLDLDTTMRASWGVNLRDQVRTGSPTVAVHGVYAHPDPDAQPDSDY